MEINNVRLNKRKHHSRHTRLDVNSSMSHFQGPFYYISDMLDGCYGQGSVTRGVVPTGVGRTNGKS